MTTDILIEVRDVAKKYCRSLQRSMLYGIHDIVNDLVGCKPSRELRKDEFWALQSISFTVKRGECLGIMGANGAGKSTLLKLLNGIFRPDAGSIVVRGKTGALIEVGAGFHPLLSGRENIYLNGAILGMSRAELDRKYVDIVEFSGLEPFIDAPVKTYSSGMHVRLGFSIAAHASPDILLIDEVLAVGDASFRARCFNRIHELAENSALVFVSHFTPHVARLCDSVVVLDSGVVTYHGPTVDGIQHYQETLVHHGVGGRHGTGDVRVKTLRFLDAEGVRTSRLHYGVATTIEIILESHIDCPSIVVDLGLRSTDDAIIAEINNYVVHHPVSVKAGVGTRVMIAIDKLELNPGAYHVSAFVLSADMTLHYDWIERAETISVHGARTATAGVQFAGRWQSQYLPIAEAGGVVSMP